MEAHFFHCPPMGFYVHFETIITIITGVANFFL